MAEPTHYEVLGVAEDAPDSTIRRRFRALARRAHPDANPGDGAAHERFIRINQAYQVLIDPVRRADYDLALRDQRRRADPYSRPGTRAPAGSHSGENLRAEPSPPPGAQTRFRTAERVYLAGRYGEARDLLEQLIRTEPQFAPAYELLGQVHEAMGELEQAITHYTIAAQLDPKNVRVMDKLEVATERLLRERRTRAREGQRSTHRPQRIPRSLSPRQRVAQRVMLASGGLSVIMFVVGLVAAVPGTKLGWPLVSDWTDHLLAALSGCGGFGGFVLSLAGILRPIDEELVFPSLAGGHGIGLPVGLLLFVSSALFFPLACFLYAVIALVQEGVSASVLVLFGATIGLILAFATVVAYPGGSQVLLLGGNVIFPCMLIGWLVGDIFRPDWS